MASSTKTQGTLIAFGVATLGIACFSIMDALMKGLAIALGTYNALLWRVLALVAMAGLLFFVRRSQRTS